MFDSDDTAGTRRKTVVREIQIGLILITVCLIVLVAGTYVGDRAKREQQQLRHAYSTCVMDASHKLPPNTDAALYCKTVLGL